MEEGPCKVQYDFITPPYWDELRCMDHIERCQEGRIVFPESAPPGTIDDYSEEDYSTEPLTDDVPIRTDNDNSSILITDLKSLRKVLATKVKHNGGQLSKTCAGFPGFICLPLSAVGMLRYPDKRHNFNPKVFIYAPVNSQEIDLTGKAHPDIQEISNILWPL